MKHTTGLPLFFEPGSYNNGQALTLSDNTAKHVATVLRKQVGDIIGICNGEGLTAKATLFSLSKKQVVAILSEVLEMPPAFGRKTAIAIAPVKNTSRLEWFLEKAAELGVAEIFLLQTARTEKTHLRFDRLGQILISAMLQSQQYHLCRLHQMQPLQKVISETQYQTTCIAHCADGEKKHLTQALNSSNSALVLIGPEGDFTPEEIDACIAAGYKAVALGNTRLRTETAALAAAVLCRQLF